MAAIGGYPLVPESEPGWFSAGPLRAYLTNHSGDGWHLSVSRMDRIPTWEEVMRIKRELIPAGVFMLVCVPPDEFWMNGFPNVLQLCEVLPAETGAQLIEHMKGTAIGATRVGWNKPPDYGRDLTRT